MIIQLIDWLIQIEYDTGDSITYGEVYTRTLSLTAALVNLGVQQYDVILSALPTFVFNFQHGIYK